MPAGRSGLRPDRAAGAVWRKDAGTATPHHITRHSHPKVRPEPLPGDDAPRATGIDYLSLLGDQHDRHLAGRVNYAALGPASPGSDGEDAGEGHLWMISVSSSTWTSSPAMRP
jgi:hypothetical protein